MTPTVSQIARNAFKARKLATQHEADVARLMHEEAVEAGHFGATPVAYVPNADADKRNPLQALILAHAATQDGPITQTETAEAIGWRRTSNGWHITDQGRKVAG